jgi:hypothetical protein
MTGRRASCSTRAIKACGSESIAAVCTRLGYLPATERSASNAVDWKNARNAVNGNRMRASHAYRCELNGDDPVRSGIRAATNTLGRHTWFKLHVL